jgi:UTP--glucose-1-phosphate uridylyltransferase
LISNYFVPDHFLASFSYYLFSDELLVSDNTKPWGEVIVASLIVNAVTLIGVIFIAGEWLRKIICPTWKSGGDQHRLWTHNLIPQFACGALLATTFFLVLPEALLLIQADFTAGDDHEGHGHRARTRYLEEGEEDHSGEAAATWRFGSAILGGFLIPVIAHMMFPHHDHFDEHPNKPTEVEDSALEENGIHSEKSAAMLTHDTGNVPEVDESVSSKEDIRGTQDDTIVDANPGRFSNLKNYSLMTSLFIGDFMHNFADGVFLGTSFLLCSRSLALTIAAATIFHELAQEVADYFMLVHHCGMRPFGALVFNFVCGFSIMFGALLVLSVDMPSSAVGAILCVGGGVYIHVAVAECLPVAQRNQKSKRHKLYGLLAFISGAVPIGLVLLNHQHCEAH